MDAVAGVRSASRHPKLLPSAALVAAVVALWPSLLSLLEYWADVRDYQHGYVIALLTVVWAGLVLRRFPAQQVCTSAWGCVGLSGGVLAWLVALRGGVDILHQLLWPAAVWLAGLSAGGGALACRLFAPLAFLYFAVPVWEYALPVLQRLSILGSERMLAMLGVEATVTEYRVTIPEGTFAIIEGCSGKRYFMVTLALAWLAIAVNRVPRRHVIGFLAVSALLAVVMNWIRIVIVIYTGHVSNMQHYLVAVEHKTLGNVMFAILLVIVLLLARWLGGLSSGRPESAGASCAMAGGPKLAVHLSALVLLALAGLLAQRSYAARTVEPSAFSLPLATADWQGPLPPASAWYPDYLAPDAERRASYGSLDGSVEVYANLYLNQSGERELIRYGNNLVAPAGWERPWSAHLETINTGKTALGSVPIRGPAGGTWLLARAFVVGQGVYSSELVAKLAYGWRSIWHASPAGVIAIAAPCDPTNCDHAQALIVDFWDNQQPGLQAMVSGQAK